MKMLHLEKKNLGLAIVVVGLTVLLALGLPVSVLGDSHDNVPGVPVGLTAKAVHAGIVDVEWDEVTGAQSFEVQVMPGGEWIALPGKDIEIAFYGPGAIVRNLPHEGRYYFSVRARNESGASEWSAFLFVQATGTPSEWSGVPEPVNAAATGTPSIVGRLSVAETLTADTSGIADANGLERVRFRHQWASSDGTTDTDIEGATSAGYTLVSADEGRTIMVRVSFTDRGGYEEGPLTGAATPEVGPEPEVPGAPRNPSVALAENGELTLSWEAPDSDGGARVTGYRVEWKSDDQDYSPPRQAVVDSLSHRITGLTNGSDYRLRVLAVNRKGEGPASDEVTGSPQDTTPPEFLATDVRGAKITLTYNKTLDADSVPTGEAFGVTVNDDPRQVSDVSAEGSLVKLDLASAVRWNDTATVSYTPPSDLQAPRIKDTWGNSAGSFSGALTPPLEVPGPPRNLSARGENGELELSWDAPDSNGGSQVRGYRVQWKSGYEDYDPTRQTEVEHPSYTATGLTDGVEYTLRVMAWNEIGEGPASAEVAASPQDTVDPELLTVAIHYATLRLHFSEALAAGSAPSEAAFNVVVSGAAQQVTNVSVEGRTLVLTLASPASSSDTVALSYTAPADPVAARIEDLSGNPAASFGETAAVWSDIPGPPMNLRAYPGESGVLTALWEAPSSNGSSQVTEYRLQWKSRDEDYDPSREAVVTGGREHSITGLANGVEHALRVFAINSAGHGPSSLEVARKPRESNGPLYRYIEEEVVERYEGGSPWLRRTWEYMQSDEFELRVSSEGEYPFQGAAWEECWVVLSGGSDDELAKCRGRNMILQEPYTRSISLILHEMGHVYTYTNAIHSYPGPEAIAWLYFDHPQFCAPSELYADALVGTVYSAAGETNRHWWGYWDACGHYPNAERAPTPQAALAEMQLALNGEYPEWLHDTYADEQGNLDLVGLWDQVQRFGRFRDVVSYGLRNEFGGYCSNYWVRLDLMLGYHDQLNPWRAGGCLPSAPRDVNVVAGDGQVIVKWKEPLQEGALPISHYRIQWKELGADYYSPYDLHRPNELAREGTISRLSNGVTYKVRVAAAHPNLNVGVQRSGIGAWVELTVTPGVNSRATGPPAISGIAHTGQTLTVDTSGIVDADGLTNVSYSYQWIRSDGTTDTDIQGATSSTYTLSDADKGKTISVRLSFTDDAGHAETLTSAATTAVAARPNSSATGAPAISGTAQVGETLTAEVSGVTDADGLTNVSFSYQWIWSDSNTDTDIAEEKDSTYTLVSADEGKTIKVRVTFTDDANNEETLTSAPTAAVEAKPNSPATGAPTISGTAQVDETLTVSTSSIADADGLTNVSYGYQWIRNDGNTNADIAGEAASTYTLVTADQGKNIKVRVSFTDDADHEETLTSAATGVVAAKPNSPATGAPTIDGTAQVGETLTVLTNGIADADGLTNVSYSYQWLAANVEIEGATNSTYTLSDEDEGKAIQVMVSFTDDADHEETLTSAATGVVAAKPNSPATGAPTIDGTARVGETLTALTNGITDEDGLTNPTFTYQWVSNDGNTDTDIQDATDSTYVLTTDDVGKGIKVKVTFTDDSDNEETLTSAASAAFTAQASRYLEDHHGDTMATASALEIGVQEGRSVRQTGVIYPADDVDYFRFTVTATDVGHVNLVMYEIAANSGVLPYAKSVLLTESGECAIHDCDHLSLRDDMVYLEEGIYYLKVSVIEGTDLPDSSTARRVYGVAWKPLAGDERFEECVSIGTSDSDPYFSCQTSLLSQAEAGHGMNVAAAWEMGAYGDGVVVNLVDVGVNPLHSDLVGVVDESRSGSDVEGRPIYQPRYSHGTKMAGIIAAQHNRVGGRGVAPGATILSYSPVRIGIEMHTALKHEHEDVAVSNNSWGWISLERPHSNLEAIEEGVLTGITDGFHGKGTLYVFPTTSTVNSNMASSESFYAILPVCGVGEDGTAIGEGNNEGGYGDNLWVCAAYAGYAPYANTRYIKLAGLSTATASASGVAALVRGVNPELTWRDVKLILAESAHRNDPEHPAWMPAGNMYGNPSVNYHFNPNYGFGLIDAAAAVALAQDWVNLPPMETARIQGERVDLPDMASVEQVVTVVDDGETTPLFIEHVEVRLEIRHQAIRDLSIELVSPGGIVSKLLWPDAGVPKQGVDFARYSMGSTRFMGQNPVGEWTLRVADHIENRSGTIYSWSLIVRGHRPPGSPTGLAIISGTAQVDETLTAGTSDIADEDGLTNVSYSYQWIRSNGGTDTDIVGETNSTYTLVSADQGKTIKVKVTFTDDADNQESLTSAATAAVVAKPNTAPTGLATISGTAQVDETLTAGTSDIADENGLTNVSYSYQWIRSDGGTDTDIVGETNSTYTLVSADQGKTIKVKVTFTDDADNQESLTSPATTTVVAKPNTAPTGLPTISGTAQVDETLTADTSDIADDDGLTDPTFTYQWVAGGADISGATSSTYFLTSSEQGQTIQVQASFTDDADNQERLTSEATAAVAPRSYSTVWSADMLVVEYTETSIGAASADLFSNIGGSRDPKIKSLWSHVPSRDIRLAFQEGISDADDLTLIVGELTLEFPPGSSGNSSFKWTDVDVDWEDGEETQVRIVQTSALEEPEKQEEPADNTPASGAPTISGTAQVDETLTAETSSIADEDGLDGVSYSYQWTRSDGPTYADLAGETDSTYTPIFADQGKTIKVRVSFTDDADNEETLTSVATVPVATAPNRDATGAPTINGTPQVEQTLTADTSGISDSDGLTSVSYSYQWIAGGSDIDAATGSSYTLTAAEQGQTVQVRVTFTDDADNAESLTSVPTVAVAAAPNREATGQPTIGGTPQAGETLTADTSAIGDEDGLTNVSYRYQWIADGTDIDGATASTYTLTYGEQGQTIQVRVTFTDDADNEETLTSVATVAIAAAANRDATGAPTISGTPQVKQTLTADTSAIADEDGLTNTTFQYQWIAGGSDIAGATGSSYELTSSEQGQTIHVRVTFTDDRNNEETLTSLATVAVTAAPNQGATGAPTISGTPQVEQTLTADTSPIADEDGLTNATFEYQWIADGTDIEGATGSSYELTGSEEGKTIQVKVSFTDDRNNDETLTSLATVAVAAAPNRDATGLPTISGTAQVGETLTADTSAIADEDGLDNVSYGYQWLADDSDIGGATGSSHTLAGADQGKTIKVKVSFTDDAENQETLTSAATDAVAAKANNPATGLPAISGTAQVGETLTADTSAIADEDGLSGVTYSYQWVRNDGETGTDINDATDSTYTLTDHDAGKTIRVRVSFTDDAGNQESLASLATGRVAATKPGVPGHLRVLPHDTGALGVYWEAPASDGGSNITGYKVQWKESADGWDTPADVSEETVTGATHTITGLTGGVEYTVRVRAVNDAGEGPPSAEASGTPQKAAIWSATLTVGVVAERFAGYTTFLPDSTVVGALSSDTITLDEANYTVKALGVLDGKLILSVIPKLAAGFVLVVGMDEFASTDASTQENGSLLQFQWNDPGLDLPEGEEVAVRLTAPGENTPATGEPTITGTAQVDQTLTANTSAIADTDGLTNVSYSYQWIRSVGGTDTDIEGETASTYTLTGDDQAKAIKVRVTFTDDEGNNESLISQATEAVAATVPTAPLSLTVTAGSQVQELEASWQAPSSNGGSAVTGYKVQWKESTDRWDTAAEVSEATETGTTHTITGLTGGVEYAVRVIASNDVGDGPASTEVKGTPAGGVSEQIVEPENSAPTGLPSISGTPQVDRTLTADTSNIDDEDGLTNVSYRYQWSAGGSDIEGATGSTYTLTYSEQGQTIQVRVTFTDDRDNAETLTSAATVAVAAAPNRQATGQPTIGGTPQVDLTLTADTSPIDDEDGLTNVSYRYQWIAGGSDIDGATGFSYELTSSEQGQAIQVRVTFTDDRNNAETLTSEATVEVTAVPVPLTASFLAAPSSHDGDNPFTFELRFSEEVELSYVTLRDDDAFSVTDGEVTGASRLDKPGNLRWQIVVGPDSGADVTIVLPATTDCGAQGAICTAAGKKLSGRVELTVNGPEQQNQEQQNNSATGAPAVSGTPQVGETLTASTSDIDDEDGLTKVSYRYQWIAGGSDIDGATGSSHTLTASEEGQTIQVRVTFTDDAGNDETLTSEATAAVAASDQTDPGDGPNLRSYITVVVAEDTSDPDNPQTDFTITWSDVDACSTGYNAYFSNSMDVARGGDTTHLGSAVTDGSQIASSLSNVEGEGIIFDVELYCGTEDSGRLVSSVKIPHDDGPSSEESNRRLVPDTYSSEPPLLALTISPGTLTPTFHGHTLQYTISDVVSDGARLTLVATAKPGYGVVFVKDIIGGTISCSPWSLSCQGWNYQDGDGNQVYPLTDADADEPGFQVDLAAGEKISLHVIRAYGGMHLEDEFYRLTDIRVANTPATGAPTISGTPQVEETLTADTANIADQDGLTGVSYRYQWIAGGADISGATGASHTLTAAEEGQTIQVRVDFTDDAGNDETLTSAATVAVAPKPNSEPTGLPAITGTPRVGETLTADTSPIDDADGLTSVSYRYQWVAGGSDISGATGSSYLLTTSEQGQTIQVKATFTDDADNQESLTSAETLAVAARPNTAATGEPTISGTPQVDETLTADTSAISDEDGLANVSYQYQWLRDGADIAGQTNSTYTLVTADEGKTIRVRVTFRDDADNQETLTSAATTAVAARPTPAVLLTASFANVPDDHNGGNFTFQLIFSENVKAGYARIRDHAFTISGTSTIASAVRKTQGSNQNWTITVQPGGNEDIVITLPSTTNCSSQRGICTYDDRMLSNEVRLTVTGPDGANSRDTTAPTISSVAMTSDPDENDADLGAYIVGRSGGSIVQSTNWASGVYRIGDDVQVTVTFSENVTVTGSPQLELAIGSNSRTAGYESTDGSAVVFSYTVAVGDSDSDGIAVAANKLTLNGGSVKDAANNDADLSHNALTAQAGHEVDGVRPRLKLTVSDRLKFGASSGGTDGAYTTGEELIIRVAFTEGGVRGSVTGPPRVALNFDGGGPRVAKWDPSLIFNPTQYPLVRFFSYVVQEGDLDSDGPTIGANAIDLAGGFIRDAAGNDAVLTHSAVAASSSFIVDAVAPTVSSIAITSDPGSDDTYGTGDKIEVTVTFSENMSIPTSITCSSDVVHCKAELELDIGGTARTADYQSHDGAEVVYAYTVQAGDTDDNGIAIGDNKLTGQRIMDATGKFGYAINDADLSHDALADNAGHKVSGTS